MVTMANIFTVIRRAMRALVFGIALSTLIPVFLGLALEIPVGTILTLVASTFILQANGVWVGRGLGLDPLVILVVMIFVELGAVLAIYEILRAFEESERVKRFVQKAETAIQKYPILSKYGAVTLMILPAMPIVGLYSSVPIGWLFRWKKSSCVFFITLGWILVVSFLLLLALGILPAIF
jgi:uncharacterized membrane protein